MPARARNAATTVATIQPVDLVVGAVGVVVGVDMMVIFLSLWIRTFLIR
jgi:hypothetical protein